MTDLIEHARLILANARRIVSFSGAGLSAESGVPTFRGSSGDGLWSKCDPMTLASPHGFARDPKLVIDWYNWRRGLIAAATPNPAHVALAQRDDLVHVTQNVDDLLDRAGAARVIQLHGAIARDRCNGDCGVDEPINLRDPPPLRRCSCGAYFRPGVVWFGEALPMDAWDQAERACTECDAMLVIGTSAAVYPATGLIKLAKTSGAKIVIVNTDAGGADHLADAIFIGRAGELVPCLLA